jgi:hypothetical protein
MRELTSIGQLPMRVPCGRCGHFPFSAAFSAVAEETVASSGANAAELLVRVGCAVCGDEKALIRLELDVAISSSGQPVIFISEFERHSAKTL